MLVCNLSDYKYNYEFEKLVRLFFPFEKITVVNELCDNAEMFCTEQRQKDIALLKGEVRLNGKSEELSEELPLLTEDYQKEAERILSVLLFKCLNKITGYKPPFGILTGVRPARLFSVLSEKYTKSGAEEYFRDKLLADENKIALCKETTLSERHIISLSKPQSFSLYISIPFCPTRCSYCSFVSHSVESAGGLIDEYVQKLCAELEAAAEIAKENRLELMTVYMGGGTPTTLSAEQLTKIFDTLKKSFDLSGVSEFTVEAGRPDTVTKEKLAAIKNAGATRISINPQTMSDAVLREIGRRHTAKQTVDAFYLARECGFDNINMDLIAGLPTDTFEDFKNTLLRVNELSPESITVHSLSMKRASDLTASGEFPENSYGLLTAETVVFANRFLKQNGYLPYYMYRQSKTPGNTENVGYCKPGFEGLYNVYIMDETHTIIACGASAVTKLRCYGGNEIKRIFNYKYPYEYIGKFEEQISRKRGITEFYEKYPSGNK